MIHARRQRVASPSQVGGLGLLLLIGFAVGARPVAAQPLGEPGAWLSIEGRVTDLASAAPLEGARVSAGSVSVRTDAAGFYSLRLPAGRYHLRFEAEGHGGATAVDPWRDVGDARTRYGERRLDLALPPVQASPGALRAAVDRLRSAAWGSADAEASAGLLAESGSAEDAPPADEQPVTTLALDQTVRAPETLRVLMPTGEIVTMDTETYLKGVVPAEMGYVFRRGFAALEAQAIASRTYAATRCLPASAGDPARCEPGLDANVDTTTRTQVWRPVHYDITDAAVEATRGQVASAEGKLLDTLFFARAVGRTRSSEDSRCCGGRSWPHLRSVGSPEAFDAALGHGAGMSQEGAAVFADWGATADEIVAHYYSGAQVDAPHPPRLYDGAASPRSGDRSTVFSFRVSYADADGDPPVGQDLLVDEQAYPMQGPSGPTLDYRMGVDFSYRMALPAGEHRIAFRFDDGTREPTRLEAGSIRVADAGQAPARAIDAADAAATGAVAMDRGEGEAEAPSSSAAVRTGSAELPGSALRPMALPAPDVLDGPEGLRAFGLQVDPDLATDARAELDDLRLFEGPVVEADFPYMAVAAHWAGQLPEQAQVDLALRSSRDGITWSPWTPLLDDDVDARQLPVEATGVAGDREGWTRLLVTRGRFLQVRAAVRGAALDTDRAPVEQLALHYFNSDAGPSAPKGLALSGQAQAAGPNIVSRAGWGADERKRFDAGGAEIWPPYYTEPRAQIIHHTVTTNDPADPAAVLRSIYQYHAVTRGWGDIGYNFLIDQRGNIYEGRYGGERSGRIVQGGHALQYNSNSIGVALLGTFTESTSRPQAAAERSLVELLAAKGAHFGIDPMAPVSLAGTRFAHAVMGHRDALPGHTQCPGDGTYGRLDAIRTGVRARMAELGAPATSAPPTSRPPTPRPSPVPAQPSPLPSGCGERVAAGGFESESPAWQRNRAYYTAWDVYRGQAALFVGLRDEDPDSAQSYASAVQTLRLPARVESARLSFAARSRGDADDIRLLRILGPSGAVIALGSERLPASSAWTEYRFDLGPALAPYAGQEIRLYFGVINNGDGKRSYLRIDEVSLVVCDGPGDASLPTEPTPAPGPPSATPSPRPSAVAYPGPGGGYVTPTPGSVFRPGPICDTLLADDFEDATLDRWNLTGDLPAARETDRAFDGQASLRLGLTDPSQDRFGFSAVSRRARMPLRAISATLSLRLAQPLRGAEDALLIELRRPASGLRETLLRPGPPPEDALQLARQPAAEPGWDAYRLRLPERWLEGEVELYLALLNRGQAEAPGQISAALVDALALEVCRLPDQACAEQQDAHN
ncbi:MAG: N-acetylmuramoyl-L-alanine amidase [Chloroflexi bacterium]|nr:N-acetylmuramoyl-L-alanine amidase [Chloroflexota bacterium]